MNKKEVDNLIPLAYEVLKKEPISKTLQSYFSTFGSALSTGSLLATVCFFNQEGGSMAGKNKVNIYIYQVLKKANKINENNLTDYILNSMSKNEEYKAKENCLNAAIAIKLAINLFDIKKDQR